MRLRWRWLVSIDLRAVLAVAVIAFIVDAVASLSLCAGNLIGAVTCKDARRVGCAILHLQLCEVVLIDVFTDPLVHRLVISCRE